MSQRSRARCGPRGVSAGWVYGWVPGRVYRVGNTGGYTGYYPASSLCPGRPPYPAERAPEAPWGLEWVGYGGRAHMQVFGGGDGPRYHLRPGRSTLWPSLYLGPWNAASGPIRRDLASFPRNLVKTAKCHLKSVKRPTIVPISKTGVKSHLLNFPDFRFREPSLTRN